MRFPSSLPGALLLALVLVGCGDDPEPRAAAPSPSLSASPPPSASPSMSASPSPSASPPPSTPPVAPVAPAAAAVRLTGDGVDTRDRVVTFGEPFGQAEPALRAALGAPTTDSGEQQSFGTYGTCPGTRLRALEFGGGALYVLFGDVQGQGLTMYQWTLTERGRAADVPQASALVGDVTTFEFGVGDTLAELREGSSGAELQVRPGDEVFGPSFTLQDQSSGFRGHLTGTADADRVTAVQAGQPCGE